MWKRILWDILCFGLVIVAPWWVTLTVGTLGAVIFSWYLELVFLGALYDALFGGIALPWYRHLIHTGIFSIPLLLIELIKTRINV